jgi:hypothetical protein
VNLDLDLLDPELHLVHDALCAGCVRARAHA